MQRIVSHFKYLSASLWDVLEFLQIFLNTYLSVWTAGIQQYAMEIPIQIENLQNKESELYCWDVLDAVSVILLMPFLIFRECFCSIMLFGPWCLHPTEWSTDSFIAGVLLLNPARVLKIIKHSSGKILNWSKALSVFRQRTCIWDKSTCITDSIRLQMEANYQWTWQSKLLHGRGSAL